MRIISKFRDFYDGAMKEGIDKECLYLRDKSTSVYPNKHTVLISMDDRNFGHRRYTFRAVLIGFCGKIYPGIHVFITENGIPRSPGDKRLPDESFYIRDKESWKKYVKDLSITLPTYRYLGGYTSIFRKDGLEEFFNKNTWEKELGLFIKHRVPVFSIYPKGYGRELVLELNPSLKDLEFQKVLDPFTTFQEIYMYLAGVIGNKEKEVTGISDKVKAQQRGFDKTSFRTQSPGKKFNRRNKK